MNIQRNYTSLISNSSCDHSREANQIYPFSIIGSCQMVLFFLLQIHWFLGVPLSTKDFPCGAEGYISLIQVTHVCTFQFFFNKSLDHMEPKLVEVLLGQYSTFNIIYSSPDPKILCAFLSTLVHHASVHLHIINIHMPVTRATWRVPLVEQEQINLSENQSFCVMFCRSTFILLSFLFWPLYCLFFDLWLLITHLVS
jgi:hypothetical protein